MPTRSGRRSGIVRLVETLGGTADPVCSDPPPPLYDFLPAIDRVRTDPDPDGDYDLLVISDCGALDRIGAVGRRHAELFERLPRVVIDHHASNDGVGRGRLDRSGRRRDLRDGRAPRDPPRRARSTSTAGPWRPP